MSDLPRALQWFGALFGRPADETVGDEHLWQVGENAWIAVEPRPDRIGQAVVTLGVPDLDTILARLEPHGTPHTPVETYANGVRHTTVQDPDGNTLSLAEPPNVP
ncbi:VOC family protein [Spirillospora sp. NPDC052242]